MTDTDPRRVETLHAQYPGPVRLTPSPRKWLLFYHRFGRLHGADLVLSVAALRRAAEHHGWLVIATLAVSVARGRKSC